MNNELKSVKTKIAKLFALGNSNSNEAEAQIALQRAGKLMEEFALTIDDIELGQENIVHEKIVTSNRSRPATYHSLVPLGEFTSVKVWIHRPSKYDRKGKFEINVIGYDTDVEMFKFFYNMLENTFSQSWKAYKNSKDYANRRDHGRSILSSFKVGFNDRISASLRELVEANETIKTKSGTALVPLKMGKVEEFFDEKFDLRLRRTKTRATANNYSGYVGGRDAGDRVQFNRPVNGGNQTLQITGK